MLQRFAVTLTLLAMRHGKSRWDEQDTTDLHRSLSKRGKRDSVRMGEEIDARDLLPDVILCSPAKRAKSTVRRVIRGSGYSGKVIHDPRLYCQGVKGYLSALSALPDEVHTAMVVGHDPDLEELVGLLTSRVVHLPTAAVACVDLSISTWASLQGNAQGNLRELFLPRELREARR